MNFWEVEPSWGVDFLMNFHAWLGAVGLMDFATRFADARVFVFPVFLVVFYVGAWVVGWREGKKLAVWIFLVTMLCAVVNIFLQFFVFKLRPDQLLDLGFQKHEELILYRFLPKASFPSDHASVGFGIGTAVLVVGRSLLKKSGKIWKNFLEKTVGKILVSCGVLLLLGAALMSLARVGIGIHWPTDVLVGLVIGVLVPGGIWLRNGLVKKGLMKLAGWLVSVQEWVG